MTSEKQYGIVEQPGPTCDLIAPIHVKIKHIQQQCRNWQKYKDDTEYLSELVDNFEYLVDEIDSELQNITTHVEKIRAWGQDWKDLIKEKNKND